MRELLDMLAALRVTQFRKHRRAVAVSRLFLPPKFRVKVALGQPQQRIGGIFLHKRPDDFECVLILLIVVVQIDCQVEARLRRTKLAGLDRMLELPYSFLLASSRMPMKNRSIRAIADSVSI